MWRTERRKWRSGRRRVAAHYVKNERSGGSVQRHKNVGMMEGDRHEVEREGKKGNGGRRQK